MRRSPVRSLGIPGQGKQLVAHQKRYLTRNLPVQPRTGPNRRQRGTSLIWHQKQLERLLEILPLQVAPLPWHQVRPALLPCQRLDPLAGQQQTKAKVEGAQPPQPLPAIGRQRLHRRKQPDIGGALNSFRQQAVNAVGIDHQKRPPSPQFGHCAVDMDGEPLALPVGQERRVLGVHPTIV